MNECFLLGTIINKVNFRFAIGGKHDSIIEFELKLENESVIMVKAYDKLADYCYQNITENNLVMIRGKLESDFKIDMSEIYFFRTKGVKEFGKETCKKKERIKSYCGIYSSFYNSFNSNYNKC